MKLIGLIVGVFFVLRMSVIAYPARWEDRRRNLQPRPRRNIQIDSSSHVRRNPQDASISDTPIPEAKPGAYLIEGSRRRINQQRQNHLIIATPMSCSVAVPIPPRSRLFKFFYRNRLGENEGSLAEIEIDDQCAQVLSIDNEIQHPPTVVGKRTNAWLRFLYLRFK